MQKRREWGEERNHAKVEEITEEEVEKALMRMKLGKAVGLDHRTIETWRPSERME